MLSKGAGANLVKQENILPGSNFSYLNLNHLPGGIYSLRAEWGPLQKPYQL